MTQARDSKKTRKDRYKKGNKFLSSNENTLGDFFERV